MSYILDALKKAEHDRNLGDAPRLTFAPLSETQKNRSHVLWVLVAILGITVGVLAAMQISQWRSVPETEPAVAPAVTAEPAPVAEKVKPKVVVVADDPQPESKPEPPKSRAVQVNTPQGPVEIDMPLAPEPKATAPAKSKPVARPVESRPDPVVAEPESTPGAPESVQADRAAPAEPSPKLELLSPAELAAEYEGAQVDEAPVTVEETESFEPEPEPVVEENLAAYYGLPASTRKSIGELAMSAHVYSSTPGRGFVMINGSRYREGDRLDEGPTLDEIRPEGAVLNYRGQRFLLPVPR